MNALTDLLAARATPSRKTITDYSDHYRRRRNEIVTLIRGVDMFALWRCVMRIFIAALALTSLIASASLTQTANAAPVSPASSAFGSNGY